MPRTASIGGSTAHSSGGSASSIVNGPTAIRRSRAQVGTATEEVAEIGGERAHVRARRALDVDRQHGRVGRSR